MKRPAPDGRFSDFSRREGIEGRSGGGVVSIRDRYRRKSGRGLFIRSNAGDSWRFQHGLLTGTRKAVRCNRCKVQVPSVVYRTTSRFPARRAGIRTSGAGRNFFSPDVRKSSHVYMYSIGVTGCTMRKTVAAVCTDFVQKWRPLFRSRRGGEYGRPFRPAGPLRRRAAERASGIVTVADKRSEAVPRTPRGTIAPRAVRRVLAAAPARLVDAGVQWLKSPPGAPARPSCCARCQSICRSIPALPVDHRLAPVPGRSSTPPGNRSIHRNPPTAPVDRRPPAPGRVGSGRARKARPPACHWRCCTVSDPEGLFWHFFHGMLPRYRCNRLHRRRRRFFSTRSI